MKAHFSISGEYITTLARQWFWQEQKPVTEVRELLESCLGTTEKPLSERKKNELIQNILEYKVDLIGVDTFTTQTHLPRNDYKSIFDRMDSLEKESMIRKIQLDMQVSFEKYIDKWSTIISMHPDVLRHRQPETYQDWMIYLTTENASHCNSYKSLYVEDDIPLIETPTMGGLWLINRPELVYDCMDQKENIHCIGSSRFWQNIYEQIKDEPWAKERNERYVFSLRPKPSFEERRWALEKCYQGESYMEEPSYLSKEWFAFQYHMKKSVQYQLEPDDIKNWEGLIAPNGDFYSCEFGGHNQKAYFLIVQNPERFSTTKEQLQASIGPIDMTNALDTLIEFGWCATRSVVFDSYLLCDRPTKAQINTSFDAIQKFNISLDTKALFALLDD